MSYPRAILFGERPDITDTIPAGQVAFWSNSGALKMRTGTLTRTLDIGVTLEEVQDYIGAAVQNSSSVNITYDDNANTFTCTLNQGLLDLINSSLQPGSNISLLNNNSGFETPAQLASRDSANRNRGNHTGTQLASTISDFEAAVFNILDRKTPIQIQYNPSNYSVNTSTNEAVIVNQNYTPIHTGFYKVVASYGHSYDEGTTDNHIELLVDNTIIKPLKKEPKDAGGSDGSSGTDQKESAHFEYIFPTVASTPFNVKFQHYSQNNGVESTIKHLDLYVERYL